LKSIFIGIVLLAAGTGAYSQTPPAEGQKVGVIDIQRAIGATKDGQKAFAALQTMFEPMRTKLAQRQAEIQAEQAKLKQGSNTMNAAERERLMLSIEQKIKSFNRETEDVQARFEEENNRAIEPLGRRILQVIEQFAKQKGYALVLDVSSQQTPVMFAANNITSEIVKLYDETPLK